MANLPIPDEQTYVSFPAATGTGPYPFTFSVFAKADLRVSVAGVELLQSEFTFSGIAATGGFDGGSVTLNTAAASQDLLIWREVVPARATDFAPANLIPVAAIDQALDRLTAYAQDARRDLLRSVRLPLGVTAPELTGPGFVALDASSVPYVAAGSITGLGVSTFMQTVLDDTSDAAARTTLDVAKRDLTNLSAPLAASAANNGKRFFQTAAGPILAYGSPTSSTLDIRDAYNALYPLTPDSWVARSAYNNKGTDWEPVATYAFGVLRARCGRGKLYFPSTVGNYSFGQCVDVNVQSGHTWVGEGVGETNIYLDGATALPSTDRLGFISMSGAGGYTLGGARGMTVYLGWDPGGVDTFYGCIRSVGDATYQGDSCLYEDLRFTYEVVGGSNRWWYDLLLMVGTSRTSPQGVREPMGRNLSFFGGRNTGGNLSGVVQAQFDNIGFYTPKPATTGQAFYISGLGAPTTNSAQITINGLVCGLLNLTNAARCKIAATAASVNAGTTFDDYNLDVSGTSTLTGSLGTTGIARIGNLHYKNGVAY